MNGKAQRQSILTQSPLLNLYRDEAVIDSTFQQFEKVNCPYLNNMLSPLYVKDIGVKAIYDKKGNKYHIDEDGILVKNDTSKIMNVGTVGFRRHTLEDWNNYIAYDIDDTFDSYVDEEPTASATFSAADNRVTFHYKDAEYTTPSLFTVGRIISKRIRCLPSSRRAVLVIYYDDDSSEKLLYVSLTEDGTTVTSTLDADWRMQQIKYSTAATYNEFHVTIKDASPVIYITEAVDGTIGVSLVNEYDRSLDSVNNGYMTIAEKDGVVYNRIIPQSSSQPASQTTKVSGYFTAKYSSAQSKVVGACISSGSGVYYDYPQEYVIGREIQFPVSYSPSYTNETVIINGVSYKKYQYEAIDCNMRLEVRLSGANGTFTGEAILLKDGSSVPFVDSDDGNSVAETTVRFYPTESYVRGFSRADITWETEHGTSESFSIPSSYFNQSAFVYTYEYTSTSMATWLAAPNVFLDNGSMYSMWTFTPSNTSFVSLPVTSPASVIIESATPLSFTVNSGILVYTFSIKEAVTVTDNVKVIRSNSFIASQNFWMTNVRACNGNGAATPSAVYSSSSTADTNTYTEYMNSNACDLKYFPGSVTLSTMTNYYTNKYQPTAASGPAEDYMTITPKGFRVNINGTRWNLLINTTTAGIATVNGISFSETDDRMGTLLSPWTTIKENSYVVANDKCVIWQSEDETVIVDIDEVSLFTLCDDRYIICNTTAYWNCYDSVKGKKCHYASDYNGRCYFGSNVQTTNTTSTTAVASGINVLFNSSKYGVTSMLLPFNTVARVLTSNVTVEKCIIPEDEDTEGIDVYYGKNGVLTSPLYKFTVLPFSNKFDSIVKFNYENTQYPMSSSGTLCNMSMFALIVKGIGNTSAVKDGNFYYVQRYSSTNVPFGLLSYLATSETYSAQSYFVLQGQFYAVMDDKIYSLIFSNGALSERDAIIDCKGMKFVGNNPMIAFFFSPNQRAFYSFTGDANLQPLYSASKFTKVLYDDDSVSFYDEMSQSIFVPTDKGLVVIGPKNQYFIEDWKDVSLVQTSVDGVTHITNGNKTINFVYYPEDGYEVLPLDIETSYWGVGNNEVCSIDRFQITLFDYEATSPLSYLKVSCQSITDMVTKSESKVIKITPDMWDKNSNSVLINYVPKLQQGQGIKLMINTPMIVSAVTAHTMDRATSQLSRHTI